MATERNRLDKVSLPNLGRRFGSGLKNSHFGPNAPVPVPQRGGGSRALNTPEEANSSESRIALHAENAGLSHYSDANSAFADPSKESRDNSVTEIDFAELKDGTLVELVEDPKDAGQACLAVWKDSEVQFVDRLEQDGQVFVPLSRKNEVLRHLRLPSAVTPYESVPALLRGLESLIAQCVAVDEKYVPVLADFVLNSWLVDRLEVAPYLSVVGLPQSGKTTLLRVLSLVCRRPLLIADVTSARKNRIFHCYGAKVISWLEPPDDAALNSRCVLIPMFESKSTALCRTDEPKMQQLAAELQAQLLTFRLENYKTVKPAAVAGDEVLRPRTRDLLRALSACHAQDTQRCQGLLKFFESGEAVPLEPLSPEHNAVLRALFAMIHIGDFSFIFISDLADKVNRFLEQSGDRLRLLPRKVGAVLTSFGFTNRTRTNSGWVLYLSQQDAEKLHQLAACYGIDGFKDRFLSMSPEDCSLCRAAGLHKRGPDLPPAPPGYQVTTKELDLRRS